MCPTEIRAFNDRIEEFRKIGCEVIVGASAARCALPRHALRVATASPHLLSLSAAGSTDSVFSHHAWANHARKEGACALGLGVGIAP